MTALLLLLALPASAASVTRAQYVMGTVLEITAEGPKAGAAVAAAFAEASRWDRILSAFKPESEASRLNRQAPHSPFACSPELWDALAAAQKAARDSGGAFDILYPKDYRLLALDGKARTATFLAEGLRVDFGGIGKGLALDRAAEKMRAAGATAGFLNFGGQILAFGRSYPVRIPGRERPLRLSSASVSTSGNSERPGHIVSPFTGKPVLGGGSTTVVAPNATEADAWSTALFVLGKRGLFVNPRPLGASQ